MKALFCYLIRDSRIAGVYDRVFEKRNVILVHGGNCKVSSMKDYTEFVQAWQASASVNDAIQRTQWKGTRASFIVTASKLRKKGVPLKKFKDTGPGSAVLKAAMSDSGDAATRNERFIQIWESCFSVVEVAERLGASYNYVCVKAHRLRKEGISLERFKRSRPRDR